MSCPAISAAMCAEKSTYQPDAVMVSKACRITVIRWTPSVFRLTADRSNPLVPLKQ